MQQRRITDSIKFSAIGLGGNIFGYFTQEKETQGIVDTAKDVGINFIDTADTYNNGASEELIGRAIKGNPDYWKIATKVGISSGESPAGLGKRERIITSCEGSLKRLGLERIELLQMHNFDPKTPIEETLSALSSLIQGGKIKAFGVSNYTMEELVLLQQTLKKFPGLRCETLQIPYNALYRDSERDIIPFCIKQDIGILPYNVLSRGVLTTKYLGNEIPENSRAQSSKGVKEALVPEILDTVRELKGIADNVEIKLSQLVIAWTLRQPGITAIPIGMRSPEHVIENSKAASIELGDEVVNSINDIVEKLNFKGAGILTSPTPKLPITI